MKLVKLMTIFLVIVQLIRCKEQDKENGVTYPKEKIMSNERFDIERFKNYPNAVTPEQEKKLTPRRDTLSDGTILDYTWWDDKNKTYYSKKIIPPAPALFAKVFEYYDTGIIKEEYELYLGFFNEKTNTSKYYDEKGYLVKTVDENVKYKDVKIKLLDLFEILKREPLLDELTKEEKEHFNFIFSLEKESKNITLEDIFKYLKRDKVLNPMNIDTTIFDTQDRFRLELSFNEEEKKWYVIKEMYPFGQISLEVDANTGKISNKKYTRETRS